MYIRSLFEAQKNVHDPRLQRASYLIGLKREVYTDSVICRPYSKRLRICLRSGSTQIHIAHLLLLEVSCLQVDCIHVKYLLFLFSGSKYERNLPSPILDRKLYSLWNAEAAALTLHSSPKDGFIGLEISHGAGDRWLHGKTTISEKKEKLYIAQGNSTGFPVRFKYPFQRQKRICAE